MSWLRIRLRVNRGEVDSLSEALEQCGAVAVTLEDAGDEALFDSAGSEEPRLWAWTSVSALLPAGTEPASFIREVTDQLGLDGSPSWEAEPLADQDWERAWMDRFTSMHFGGQLWICPSWLPLPPPPAVAVTLDPGLAFGTGTHATTALCLNWLATHPLSEAEISDCGCGSAMLAIPALRRGAPHAWAVDVDRGALAVTRENAENNGVGERLDIGSPETLPHTIVADVVIANILAKPLIELAPRLIQLTRTGGFLLLSGMLEGQVCEVERLYHRGFAIKTRIRDGWALLECRKLATAT